MTKMEMVALYARVSTKKQKKANTILSQIAEIKDRITEDGHKLLDEYEFKDNGCSGSSLEGRESLEKLRDAAAEGKIDKIYIHSPDRLSRRTAYQMILLEEFEKAGVKVVFLNNNQTDDTPESTLLVQVQGIIAEYGRTKIIERNRRGKLYAAKTSRISVMSGAPYGYRYITKHVGEGCARFEINEEEADVIRKIFIWVGEERVSIKEAARRLNNMSIITQTGKGYWQRSTVWGMLKNPAYVGRAAYGKTKVGPKLRKKKQKRGASGKLQYSRFSTNKENWMYISVPSIISEDLFNIVQEQLAENRKRLRERQRSETFLLQSLLVCQCCQYAYYGTVCTSNRNGRKLVYYYYRCTGIDASKFNGNRVCDNKSIRTDVLDVIVWEEVKVLLKEPDRVANEYQCRLSEDKKPLLDQTLEKQASKLKLSITKFIDSYSKGFISQEEFEPKIKEMKQRLKEIEEEKEKMLDKKKLQQELNLITDSLKNFSANVESKLDQVDWQTKQNIIRMLVKQVEINHDYIYIAFRIKELANLDQNRHKIMRYCPSSFYRHTHRI